MFDVCCCVACCFKNSGHVFVLAASNLPWDLDSALLRRLEKRILVPMPDKEARKFMIQSHLSTFSCKFESDVFDQFADLTTGYSGADIKLLCKEVAMRPVRLILSKVEKIGLSSSVTFSSTKTTADVENLLKKSYITLRDFKESLSSCKASAAPELLNKYSPWSSQFRSTLSQNL